MAGLNNQKKLSDAELMDTATLIISEKGHSSQTMKWLSALKL